MSAIGIKTPGPAAREVLLGLFMHGPLWDGDIPSKDGRTELVEMGLADRGHGWNWLTSAGVEFALKVMDLGPTKERRRRS